MTYLEEPMVDTPFVLGMMRLTDSPEYRQPAKLASWIEQQLELGLHWFDHADIYGDQRCERIFGEALALVPELKSHIRVIDKADIVISTRDESRWHVKHYDSSPDYLRAAVEGSLARLNLERLDLFLIHRPDPLMDVEETAAVMDALVDEGKVAALGVSNFLPEQWRLLNSRLKYPLRANQMELSLSHVQPLFNGDMEALQRDQLQCLSWSPLAGGRFAEGDVGGRLSNMAKRYGCSETTLALAWLRRIPSAPVPVLGSMKAERIAAALQGEQTVVRRADWYALLEASRGHQVA